MKKGVTLLELMVALVLSTALLSLMVMFFSKLNHHYAREMRLSRTQEWKDRFSGIIQEDLQSFWASMPVLREGKELVGFGVRTKEGAFQVIYYFFTEILEGEAEQVLFRHYRKYENREEEAWSGSGDWLDTSKDQVVARVRSAEQGRLFLSLSQKREGGETRVANINWTCEVGSEWVLKGEESWIDSWK